MKKKMLVFALIMSCTNIFAQLGYRFGSSFIELSPDSSSLYFVQTKSVGQMMKMKESIKNNDEGVKIVAELAKNACIVNSKSFGAGNYISEIYKDNENHRLIMLPRFAVKMKTGHEIDEVLTLFGQYLTFDKKEHNIYKVNCCVDNSADVLTLNEEINLIESVEWCEPMMIGKIRKYNTLEGSQYYLNNTGQNGGTIGIDINVKPAWNIVTVDTTLVVAVIDDGVDRNHEDLIGSVLPGMTIDYPNEYGDPINDYPTTPFWDGDTKSHGTACAGIIAARNNSIGIRGVASGVKILPVNVNPYTPYDFPDSWYWFEQIAMSILWAYDTQGADVISWSGGPDGFSAYISIVLTNAVNNGRNGKGTIVVCASGNSTSNQSVVFPASMDETIAVGAINKNGGVWSYSCGGNKLDLVAPSGDCLGQGDVVTTDRSAPYGENAAGNYMYNFGGTSAACPQVAGVVALMLSANPNLTASQVHTILRNTARDVNTSGFDNATGYGLVDAYAAVYTALVAGITQISGPTIPGSPSTYYVQNLPSGWSVVWSMQGKTTLPSYCTINYPAANQLQINNSSKLHIQETLVAKVYNANGTLVKTLTKYINTADGFTGSYSQTIPTPYEVLWGGFHDGSVIQVKQGYNVALTSNYFYGVSVSYTCFPPYPLVSTSGNTINITLHSSTDFSNCLFHCVNGDRVIEFRLRAAPTLFIDPILHIMAGNSGEGNPVVNISVSTAETEGETRQDEVASWNLTIYSYTTGKIVHTQKVTGASVSIDTSAWKPDIYVVSAKIDGKEITEKFTLNESR